MCILVKYLCSLCTVHFSSSEPDILKESTWLKEELVDTVGLTKKVPLEHGIVKPRLDSEEIHVARLTGRPERTQGEVCSCVETDILRAPAVGTSPSRSIGIHCLSGNTPSSAYLSV